jgi:hypothetical protein
MKFPTRGKHFRNIALLYGVTVFLWIPIEDFQTLPVVIFGTLLALLVLSGWVLNKFGGKTIPTRYLPIAAGLIGAVAGLSSAIASVGLMFFKTSVHAHPFPDYPLALMLAMLERAPMWTLAGALLGLGAALLWLALRDIKPTTEASDTNSV